MPVPPTTTQEPFVPQSGRGDLAGAGFPGTYPQAPDYFPVPVDTTAPRKHGHRTFKSRDSYETPHGQVRSEHESNYPREPNYSPAPVETANAIRGAVPVTPTTLTPRLLEPYNGRGDVPVIPTTPTPGLIVPYNGRGDQMSTGFSNTYSQGSDYATVPVDTTAPRNHGHRTYVSRESYDSRRNHANSGHQGNYPQGPNNSPVPVETTTARSPGQGGTRCNHRGRACGGVASIPASGTIRVQGEGIWQVFTPDVKVNYAGNTMSRGGQVDLQAVVTK